MAARSESNCDEIRRDAETNYEGNDRTEPPALSLLETRPGRSVLTEEDNTDGWIATDLTVEVRE